MQSKKGTGPAPPKDGSLRAGVQVVKEHDIGVTAASGGEPLFLPQRTGASTASSPGGHLRNQKPGGSL